MLSWEDGLLETIAPNDGYEIVIVTSDFSIHVPLCLIPDRAPLQLILSTPSDIGHGTHLLHLFYNLRTLMWMYRL